LTEPDAPPAHFLCGERLTALPSGTEPQVERNLTKAHQRTQKLADDFWKRWEKEYLLEQCFSTFVRPQPGKFFFYKTRARSQQIIGLQAIFMTGHKQQYSLSRMLKDLDV
jgi:hypothetical protein